MTDLRPDALWPVILGQLVVLPLLAMLATMPLRRSPARAHAVCAAGLVATLAAPPLAIVAALAGYGLLPGAEVEPAIVIAAASASPDDPARAAVTFGPASLLAVAWAIVSSVLLARLAIGFGRGFALARSARPCRSAPAHATLARLDDPVARRARLFDSPAIDSPAIFSWCRRPRILLPSRLARGDDPHALEQVLRHEIAHLARHDHWWRLVAELGCCLVPWHPAVHWLRRRVYETSELACDARVVRDEQHPERYAETLLRLTPCRTVRLPALSAVRSAAPLDRRIRAILAGDRAADRSGAAWMAATVVLAGTVTATAAFAQRRPPHVVAPDVSAEVLAASPIQPWPEEIDLGTVAPGGTAEGVIHLVNVGARPERVTEHKPSCGCTTLEFTPTTLAPGDVLKLDVRIAAPKEAGVERLRTVKFMFENQEAFEVRVRMRTSA